MQTQLGEMNTQMEGLAADIAPLLELVLEEAQEASRAAHERDDELAELLAHL